MSASPAWHLDEPGSPDGAQGGECSPGFPSAGGVGGAAQLQAPLAVRLRSSRRSQGFVLPEMPFPMEHSSFLIYTAAHRWAFCY